MNATLVTLLAFGGAAGLALAVSGLFPPRPTLRALLADLNSPPSTSDPGTTAGPAGPLPRLGRGVATRLAGPLGRWGLPTPAAMRDLAVIDRAVIDHLARTALTALAAALTMALLLLLAIVAGHHPQPGLSLLGVAGGVAAGAALPQLDLRAQARQRRADISHALAVWLDVVTVLLAGGAGIEQALAQAAALLAGDAAAPLRVAVAAARLAGRPPWSELRRIGQNLGIPPLVETAATLSLAGDEGARIRAALAAKAASLRAHQAAQAHAEAVAATERMALPVALLTLALLTAIGWPALAVALNGM